MTILIPLFGLESCCSHHESQVNKKPEYIKHSAMFVYRFEDIHMEIRSKYVRFSIVCWMQNLRLIERRMRLQFSL